MAGQLKNYVWNADDYAKHSSSQYAWAKELIPKLKLSENETLLDIGCGDCKVTAVLAKCLPSEYVVGVDSSEDTINLARQTFHRDVCPNLSFKRMDARKLIFHGVFDRVFSNAALHCVVDHKSVLQGVQRSLKSGGRLLFQMGGKGNAQEALSVLDKLFPKKQ